MRKTELLEIGCLEATKKMLKFSKKEEKKSRTINEQVRDFA